MADVENARVRKTHDGAVSGDVITDPLAHLPSGSRKVAYDVDIAHALGSTDAGLWLSQFRFWLDHWNLKGRTVPNRWDGEWLVWSQEEITDQTALSRRSSETARRLLRDLGIIREIRRGIPARLWYRLDKDGLSQVLHKHWGTKNVPSYQTDETDRTSLAYTAKQGTMAHNEQAGLAEHANLCCPNTPPRTGANRHAINVYENRNEMMERATTNQPEPSIGDETSVVVSCANAGMENADLVERLVELNLTRTGACTLVQQYERVKIERQIEYLPYRTCDSPAAVLVEAIREDWSVPAAWVRAQEAHQSEKQAQAEREYHRKKRDQEQAQDEAKRVAQQSLLCEFEALPDATRQALNQAAWDKLYENPVLRHKIDRVRERKAEVGEPLTKCHRQALLALLERSEG